MVPQTKEATGDAAGSAKSAAGDLKGAAKSASGDAQQAAKKAAGSVNEASGNLSANPLDDAIGKVLVSYQILPRGMTGAENGVTPVTADVVPCTSKRSLLHCVPV